jgi:CubicO group peptidase (beta-lactamase class C family)
LKWALITALALVGGAFALDYRATERETQEYIWPGETWKTVDPKAAGLRREPLDILAREVGGDGMISRHGRQVYDWGNVKRRRHFGSSSKVLFNYLLFRAYEQGRVGGLDEPVCRYVPELAALNPGDPADNSFTWRHLATMTSCYGVSERPGEAFSYSDFQVMLFANTLLGKVYDATWERVFNQQIREPLNFEDRWGIIEYEDNDSWRPMYSTRDFNRFGLMIMRHGQWEDRQLISQPHAQLFTATPHPAALPETKAVWTDMLPNQGSYGGYHNEEAHGGHFSYYWWLNRRDTPGGKLWPDLPSDAYAAVGWGGRALLMIIPSEQLVITWCTESIPNTSHSLDGKHWVNARVKHVMDALGTETNTPLHGPDIDSDPPLIADGD